MLSLLATVDVASTAGSAETVRFPRSVVIEDFAIRPRGVDAELFMRSGDRYQRMLSGRPCETSCIVVRIKHAAAAPARCSIDFFGSADDGEARRTNGVQGPSDDELTARWDACARPARVSIRSVLAFQPPGSEHWQSSLERIRDRCEWAKKSRDADAFSVLRLLVLDLRECAQFSNLMGLSGPIVEVPEDDELCMKESKVALQVASLAMGMLSDSSLEGIQRPGLDVLEATTLLVWGPLALAKAGAVEFLVKATSQDKPATTAFRIIRNILKQPAAAELLFSKQSASRSLYQNALRETLDADSLSREECMRLIDEWHCSKNVQLLQSEAAQAAGSADVDVSALVGRLKELNLMLSKDSALIASALYHLECRAVICSLGAALEQRLESKAFRQLAPAVAKFLSTIGANSSTGALYLAACSSFPALVRLLHSSGSIDRLSRQISAVYVASALLKTEMPGDAIAALGVLLSWISTEERSEDIVKALSFPGCFYALVQLSSHDSPPIREMAVSLLSSLLHQPSRELAKLLLDYYSIIQMPHELDSMLNPYRIAAEDGIPGLLRLCVDSPSVAALRLLSIIGSRGSDTGEPADFLVQLLHEPASGWSIFSTTENCLAKILDTNNRQLKPFAICSLELASTVLNSLLDSGLTSYHQQSFVQSLINVVVFLVQTPTPPSPLDIRIQEMAVSILALWCLPQSRWFSELSREALDLHLTLPPLMPPDVSPLWAPLELLSSNSHS